MDDKLYKQLSDEAYNLHVSGNLVKAKEIYDKIIDYNPKDYNLQFLYAQLNISLKNYEYAVDLLTNIYMNTNSQEVKLSLAKVYYYDNKFEIAIDILKTLPSDNLEVCNLLLSSYNKANMPYDAVNLYLTMAKSHKLTDVDLFNLSVCYLKLNDIENALKYALKAYKTLKDDFELNIHIAGLYQRINNEDEELKYLLKSESIKAEEELLYRTGCIYKNKNDIDNAVKYFNKTLEINPKHKRAVLNNAFTLCKIDKESAIRYLEKAIDIFPDDTEILMNMYFIYNSMFNYEKTYEIAKKLIELEPSSYENYNLCGFALKSLYKLDEAEKMYLKSRKIQPEGNYSASMGLAEMYSQRGLTEKAAKLIEPFLLNDDIDSMYDYLSNYLRDKNFNKVKDYFFKIHTKINSQRETENKLRSMFHRLNIGERYNIDENSFAHLKKEEYINSNEIRKKYIKKQWHNENIKDKTLLLYSMHGIGDIFMVIRYIDDIKKLAKKIILLVDKPCYDIIKYNFPDIEVYDESTKLSEDSYDYATPLFCIFYHINTDFHDIKKSGGYLKVSSEVIKEKAKIDIMKTDKIKAGLFWQGNPSILYNRSLEVSKFKQLAELKNIQLYSFQVTDTGVDSDKIMKELNIIDLKPYIKNFTDTGGFLKNIDVLITIDSAIANFAGALGVKTFLLLPYFPEWRWFYDTEKTPWYDSVRIFKQKKPNDWDEVISRVKNEFKV